MRTNARWLVSFTTTNEVTIKHLWEEFFSVDFASDRDMEAFLDLNTRDHQCIMVDGNPNIRGGERYYTYKAQGDDEMKPFVMCPNSVWGEDRNKAIKRQRKQFKMAPKYSKAYLERMMYDAKVSSEQAAGTTDRYKRNTAFDFRRVIRT